jgi:hypothetical protein
VATHAQTLHHRLQYSNAKALLAKVNEKRPSREPYYRHCMNATAYACFTPVRVLDWLRVSRLGRFLVRKGLIRDRSVSDVVVESAFVEDSEVRREARFKAKMDDANLTWAMSMAFYALSGGCIYTSKTGEQRVLREDAIAYLATFEPQSLLQLQRVVLQNLGKANAIGKAVTCVQAFWFCSQCIARLSGDLAVSLLELNTFAHCISALLIYIFWWDKPYDVETLTFIESNALDLWFLLEHSSLDKDWMVPVIFLPRGSGRTDEASGTYTISDAQGNHLIHGRPLIHALRKGKKYDGPSYLRGSTGSKTRIPNTGLYLSFELSVNVPDPIYISSWPFVKDCWNRLWSTWVEADRPLPLEPIAHTERWLYRRTSGSPNVDATLVEQMEYMQLRPTMCVIMTLTFLVYGGLHLLAWQYKFSTMLERKLWRTSALISAMSGSVILILPNLFFRPGAKTRVLRWFLVGLRWYSYLIVVCHVASRAFLFIESFIALPNSPRSTYTIPSWTAYIPHI